MDKYVKSVSSRMSKKFNLEWCDICQQGYLIWLESAKNKLSKTKIKKIVFNELAKYCFIESRKVNNGILI